MENYLTEQFYFKLLSIPNSTGIKYFLDEKSKYYFVQNGQNSDYFMQGKKEIERFILHKKYHEYTFNVDWSNTVHVRNNWFTIMTVGRMWHLEEVISRKFIQSTVVKDNPMSNKKILILCTVFSYNDEIKNYIINKKTESKLLTTSELITLNSDVRIDQRNKILLDESKRNHGFKSKIPICKLNNSQNINNGLKIKMKESVNNLDDKINISKEKVALTTIEFNESPTNNPVNSKPCNKCMLLFGRQKNIKIQRTINHNAITKMTFKNFVKSIIVSKINFKSSEYKQIVRYDQIVKEKHKFISKIPKPVIKYNFQIQE